MRASPAEHQVYVWQPAGVRVAVEISLDVVERIGEWAREGLETEGRGIEVGGLLLGRTRRDRTHTVVEVSDAEPVECEHVVGPSFMLSASDRRVMEAQLRQRKGSVVGYYRTNTRREFVATVEDLALLESHFPMMLLVDAKRGAPLRATFAFPDTREIGSTFTFSPDALARVAAPVPMVVPTPPTAFRAVPWGWVAAAVLAAAVVAGALYEGPRRVPPPAATSKPAIAEAAPAVPKPIVEAPVETPAPSSQAPARAEVAVASSAEPAAPAPSAPASVAPVNAVPSPSAPTNRAPAVSTPLAPTNRPPAARAVSADRATAPDAPPAHRPFVAPVQARQAPSAHAADLPEVDPLPSLATTLPTVATAAPPAPARTPTPSPKPAVERRVAVSVDAVPLRGSRFVAPSTIKPAAPSHVPVARSTVINVKVYLDRAGKVEYAELLSDGTGVNREPATAAVFSARHWKFSPARVDGKVVPAQAVLRFRFEP